MRRFTGKHLLVATHNRGKREEMSALLAPFGITVSSAADHDLPEPEETGTSFIENARIKAHAAAQTTGLPRYPMIAALRLMHWAVRRGFILRIGLRHQMGVIS